MKNLFSTIALSLLTTAVLAQAPQKLNYQGVARNASGQPLASQNMKLRLTVHDLTTTGATLYQETHSVTTNGYGLYNVAVGNGTVVSGTFNTIDWATGDKYLQVEIDPNGGTTFTDAGATQLLSVPYALYTKMADSTRGAKIAALADSARAARLTLPYADVAANSLPLIKLENTADGPAFEGVNSSTTANVTAVRGIINSTTPGGFSSAVRGINNGTGGLGIGVWGSQAGGGWGVYGNSPTGIGVYGAASGSGYGVYGNSASGTAVYGISNTGGAAAFVINNNANTSNTMEVYTTGSGKAINVSSVGGSAIAANSTAGKAGDFVNNTAANASTVLNSSTTGTGSAFAGTITNTANSSAVATLTSNGTGRGLAITLSSASNSSRAIDVAHSGTGPGVFATAGGNAIWGITPNISSAAVMGDNTPGESVVGRSNNGIAGAVVGRNDGAGGYGVRGFVTNSTTASIGVLGQSGISGGIGSAGRFENVNSSNTSDALQVSSNASGANGLYANVVGSSSKAAVYGVSTGTGTNGIIGEANSGGGAYGIWGKSTSGYAGYFSGNVYVAGTLGKSAGSFKIDHPADPANKYLIHSFVESPDMMNVYNGNITTDASGNAIVSLPSYFEIENIDFKYQLTVIGQFAQAIVSKEVSGNKFEIKTDKPNVKVSWQVTGVRNDQYAQKNRIVPEVEKTADEKGYYLNPEVFGQPANKAMPYARTKGVMEEAKPILPTGAEKADVASNKAAAQAQK